MIVYARKCKFVNHYKLYLPLTHNPKIGKAALLASPTRT